MAANKRRSIQIERDRREIADLYLQGWTQQRIADHINADKERGYTLSQRMISYDLLALQKKWQHSALVDIDAAKAQELAKLDRLEREYWDAWERSCGVMETERISGDATKPSSIVKTSKNRDGDPRFLQGVMGCIDRRCKILGVDAPAKVDMTSKGEKLGNNLSDDNRMAAALVVYERVRARLHDDALDGEPVVGTEKPATT